MSEPLTMTAEREAEIRTRPHLRVTKDVIAELDAEREAHKRTQKALAIAQEGCRVAYQFCADRGACDEVLTNLDAAADNEPIPHPEWPINDGTWQWDKCKHSANTACAECLRQSQEVSKALLEALKASREAMKLSGCMNGRQYVDLGIKVNAAIALAERPDALASSEQVPTDTVPSHGGRD